MQFHLVPDCVQLWVFLFQMPFAQVSHPGSKSLMTKVPISVDEEGELVDEWGDHFILTHTPITSFMV